MSDRQKDNATRIAAYLENKLSPTEREAFKRALSEDDELRLQYIDALMNRAGTGPSPAPGEPADEKGQPGAAPGVEGRHAGGEVADEWLGIVRGAEGARDEEKQEAEQVGTDAGNTPIAGEPEEQVREANIDEREPDGKGWGAPRDWESGEHRVVSGDTEGKEEKEETAVQGEQGEGMETRGGQGATEAWEAALPGEKKDARPGFLGSRWMVAVAIVLLAVAGLVVVMLIRRQGFWEQTLTTAGADSGKAVAGSGLDSGNASGATAAVVAKGDSGKTGAGAVAAGAASAGASPLGDSVFGRLYKPYIRGDDPLELRSYYMDYRSGNYSAVLAVGDSTGLGVGQRKVVIRDYMRLYRGLSLLATGNAKDAVPELEAVVLRTHPGDILYETAQWYLALAWLKRTDVDPAEARNNALGLAKDVSNGYSRYSDPARELIKELGQ